MLDGLQGLTVEEMLDMLDSAGVRASKGGELLGLGSVPGRRGIRSFPHLPPSDLHRGVSSVPGHLQVFRHLILELLSGCWWRSQT